MRILSIRSLNWEIFRTNKITLMAALFVVPLDWVIIRSILSSIVSHVNIPYAKLDILLLSQTVFFLIVSLSYTGASTQAFSGGFPHHVLRLPLPTWLLAMVPILASSICVSLFVLMWLFFISNINLSWQHQMIIWASVTTIQTWIQASIWGLISALIQKMIVLIAVVVTITIVLQSLLVTNESLSLLGRTGGAITLLLLFFCGFIFAVLSVRRARQSCEGFNLPFTKPVKEFLLRLSTSNHLHNFKSPNDSQQWYEWQSYGKLIPAITSMPAFAILLVASSNKPTAESALILFSLVMLPFISSMAMEYASTKFGSGQNKMSSLIATRPLSNFDLGLAKLKLVGKSLGVSVLIVATTVIISFFLIQNKRVIPANWEFLIFFQGEVGAWIVLTLVILLLVSICWVIASIFVSLFLSGYEKLRGLISLSPMLLVFALIAITRMFYLSQELQQAAIDLAHLIILIPTVLITALGLFLLPRFKKIACTSQLKKPALSISVLLIICLILLWQLSFSTKMGWAISLLFANIALLSFIPFMGAPIAISKNRHR